MDYKWIPKCRELLPSVARKSIGYVTDFSYIYLAVMALTAENIHHFTIHDLQSTLDRVFDTRHNSNVWAR